MHVLRFLLAVSLLPFSVAVSLSCSDIFMRMSFVGSAQTIWESSAVLAGAVVFLVAWMVLPRPVRLYVLGHELTHALWGLLFGARPSNLKVGLRGGSVMLSKSNWVITLAPYFFPFYTVLVVVAALVTRCFVSPLPATGCWLFLVGLTWCFHACFTIQSLLQKQPDIEESGYLFSYVCIWILNLVGAMLWLISTSEVSFAFAGRSLVERTTTSYLVVYESLRSLSLLWR